MTSASSGARQEYEAWATSDAPERAFWIALGRLGRRPGEDVGEDVVQDARLHVLRKLHLFDPARGSFEAWAQRLAVNAAHDRIVAGRRRAQREVPFDGHRDEAMSTHAPSRTADDSDALCDLLRHRHAAPVLAQEFGLDLTSAEKKRAQRARRELRGDDAKATARKPIPRTRIIDPVYAIPLGEALDPAHGPTSLSGPSKTCTLPAVQSGQPRSAASARFTNAELAHGTAPEEGLGETAAPVREGPSPLDPVVSLLRGTYWSDIGVGLRPSEQTSAEEVDVTRRTRPAGYSSDEELARRRREIERMMRALDGQLPVIRIARRDRRTPSPLRS